MKSGSHYKVIPHAGYHEPYRKHEEYYRGRLVVSLLLALPLVLLVNPLVKPLLELILSRTLIPGLTLLLMLTMYFYGGWPFLKGMYEEATRRRPGMMTLVSLGITASLVYGFIEVLLGEYPTMGGELVFLILVMLTGHWIEMKHSVSAFKALKELASLVPSHATLITNGALTEVPLSEIKEGDLVLARPGERVPADGLIVSGKAHMDESLLTGESKPVLKKKGDNVLGGSLNLDGAITIAVERTGERTFLAQVMKLVEQAYKSKTAIQTIADRGAMWLTIVAIIVATISLVYWLRYDFRFAVERMVTVLVAACPHALGIGVPLAAIVTSSKGARRGILIRNRRAFEHAVKTDTVVFDKTGTLTEGKLTVREIVSLSGVKVDRIIEMAAAVEALSEHPIAQAIIEYAENLGIKARSCEEFQAISGVGVRGIVDGVEVFVGGPVLLKYLSLPSPISEPLEGTVVYVVADKKLLGKIALDDVIRKESSEAINKLMKRGLEIVMLTGDNRKTAERVARELGIDKFFAELTPRDKVEIIERLKKEGHIVTMVGDGVNDAPALVTADLGVAIGAGTQVAIESADVILVRNDPRDAIEVLTFSRDMRRKMLLNTVWTLGYNTMIITLATGLLLKFGLILTPTLGAIAMALSDIVAIMISVH